MIRYRINIYLSTKKSVNRLLEVISNQFMMYVRRNRIEIYFWPAKKYTAGLSLSIDSTHESLRRQNCAIENLHDTHHLMESAVVLRFIRIAVVCHSPIVCANISIF